MMLLIFDLDGTLVDSRADLTIGINCMRAHYGLEPLPVETVSGYIGNGSRKLVERSLQGADVDLDEAVRLNRDAYCKNMTNKTVLYGGVAVGLKQLREAGHTLAVLTNKPGEASRIIMDHFGLTDLFFRVMGGGDGEALKPEPGGILQLVADSGCKLSACWMIGDHYTDLACAANAGVKCALAGYGFGEARGYKADEQFASFPALVEYFL